MGNACATWSRTTSRLAARVGIDRSEPSVGDEGAEHRRRGCRSTSSSDGRSIPPTVPRGPRRAAEARVRAYPVGPASRRHRFGVCLPRHRRVRHRRALEGFSRTPDLVETRPRRPVRGGPDPAASTRTPTPSRGSSGTPLGCRTGRSPGPSASLGRGDARAGLDGAGVRRPVQPPRRRPRGRLRHGLRPGRGDRRSGRAADRLPPGRERPHRGVPRRPRRRRLRPSRRRHWDPPVTLLARLVSIEQDAVQHLGQAAYVRGVLQRT